MFCSAFCQYTSGSNTANSFMIETRSLKLETIKDCESMKCQMHEKKSVHGKSAIEKVAAMKAVRSFKTANSKDGEEDHSSF